MYPLTLSDRNRSLVIEPVRTRPGIMYGCKAHKTCVDGSPSFRRILFTLRTNTFSTVPNSRRGLITGWVGEICLNPWKGACFRSNSYKIGAEQSGTLLSVQPRNDCAVCHHLLNCNYLTSFKDFSVLCHENKKYRLELKEILVIMRDGPSISRNIRSAPLYQIDWVFVTLFVSL